MRWKLRLRAVPMFAGLVVLTGQALPAWQFENPAPPTNAAANLCDAQSIIAVGCAGCHSNGRARIDLDGPVDRRALLADRGTWESVLDALRDESMPPKRSPPLTPAERAFMIQWIEEEFARIDDDRFSPLAVRRLRRTEYANAVRDIFGVEWQPNEGFPRDDPRWDIARTVPQLRVDDVEVHGDAADSILASLDLDRVMAQFGPAAAPDEARAMLNAVARRAYRGRGPAAETERLQIAFDEALHGGSGVEDAIKRALKLVLTSPYFVYQIETHVRPDASHDEVDLANRLSSFLWNSVPDEELLSLAEQGLLHANLEKQTRRMLADARARRMFVDFARTWLGLGKLDSATDVERGLLQAMGRETEEFVSSVLHDEGHLLDFLSADYTYANEQLAQHYGLPGVTGEHFRRVSVSGTQRGGLVTHASMLTLTSSAQVVGTVQRGKWILEKLLGTPPPPPPAGLIAAFDTIPRDGKPSSIRKVLARHSTDAACAFCHSKIDGLGMALGAFDQRGSWHPDRVEPPSTLTYPQGAEALRDLAELKSYLLERRGQFFRGFSAELLRYALGRRLVHRDDADVNNIAAFASVGVPFSQVALAVVRSASFRNGHAIPR